MKMTTEQPAVLFEEKIYEQPEATDFDRASKRTYRIEYSPASFREAFAAILDDDAKYPTAKAKRDAIIAREPWWADHIDKVLTDEAREAIG